ncbi:MAG: hypothetical protein KAS19_11545, partial [Anaerolineales bacterium]|nr:hypothetical protein [Anaerolineales bacterium]
SPVFKTGAFDHSATSPKKLVCAHLCPGESWGTRQNRRSRLPFLTRLYLLHPWSRTSGILPYALRANSLALGSENLEFRGSHPH